MPIHLRCLLPSALLLVWIKKTIENPTVSHSGRKEHVVAQRFLYCLINLKRPKFKIGMEHSSRYVHVHVHGRDFIDGSMSRQARGCGPRCTSGYLCTMLSTNDGSLAVWSVSVAEEVEENKGYQDVVSQVAHAGASWQSTSNSSNCLVFLSLFPTVGIPACETVKRVGRC
jgi:hypothetical protein